MNKKIVFDLGGVILDFDHTIITKKLSKISSFQELEIFEFIFKSGLEKDYDTGKISSIFFYEKIIDYLKVKLSYEEFFSIWNNIFFEKYEISEFIKQIYKNYDIYLLSNTNKEHFNYCLKQFPILKNFKKYFLSYEIGFRKPDKRIFLYMIDELKVLPNEILFIDDIEENIISAKEIGIKTIHFKDYNQFYIEFSKYYSI